MQQNYEEMHNFHKQIKKDLKVPQNDHKET